MSFNKIESLPPKDTNSIFTKMVIEQLVKSLEDIKTITHNIQIQQQSTNIDSANMKLDIVNLNDKISDIERMIKEGGNGKESFLTRFVIMENNINEIKSKIDKMEVLKKESHAGKWQIIVAVTTGILGLITAIVSGLFKFL